MTSRVDLDRLLFAWFEGDAPSTEPEHLLGQVLARTVRTPRRRAWPLVERLSSMQAAMSMPAFPRAVLLVPLALLLVLAAIAMIAVGSERRVPPPFGPARPGLLAYERDGDIILANADGSGQIVLASGPVYGSSPTWSNDGSRLAYWSAPDWDKPATLTVVHPDGSGAIQVVRDVVAPSDRISWSPDGRRIAFSAQVGAKFRIMIADLSRTGATPVGDETVQGTDPVWSHDGTKLAFTGGSTYRDIAVYTVGADGTGPTRLTTVADTVELGGYDWSPDGNWLLFTAGSFSHHDVWVVAADGSRERAVAATAANELQPSWSPDGRQIVYILDDWNGDSSSPRNVKTIVVDADGSHPTIVGRDIGIGLWAPDGRSIIGWTRDADGALAPALFDPAGTGPGQHLLNAVPWSWQRLLP